MFCSSIDIFILLSISVLAAMFKKSPIKMIKSVFFCFNSCNSCRFVIFLLGSLNLVIYYFSKASTSGHSFMLCRSGSWARSIALPLSRPTVYLTFFFFVGNQSLFCASLSRRSARKPSRPSLLLLYCSGSGNFDDLCPENVDIDVIPPASAFFILYSVNSSLVLIWASHESANSFCNLFFLS